MEKDYYIYKITNKKNGLIYIGTSHQIFYKRAKYGQGYKNHKTFFSDIDKYGWDAFDIKIIESGLSKEEAGEKEKNYIKQFESTDEKKGYNVQSGGFHNVGSQRLGKVMKNIKRTYVMTEEHKKHLSEAHIGNYPTEEQNMKNRMSNPNRKEIVCIETGVVYPSIRYAGRVLGNEYSHKAIQRCLKNQSGTALGYHWKFKE